MVKEGDKMLRNELIKKGSVRLKLVLSRNDAFNNDAIMRLYLNDWSLIQKMYGFGKKAHAELKAILDNMKIKGVKK
jgi:hypothetical protein